MSDLNSLEISLVNPPNLQLREPNAFIPLGLAYLGSSLIKQGFKNTRVDNLIEKKEINMKHADIFGIYYPSNSKDKIIKISKYIRQNFPESKIILGGPHPTVAPLETMKTTNPDTVVGGEAELFLPKLVKKFQRGIYDAGIIRNLDCLPFPARHLFEKKAVVNETGIHGSYKPSTTVITSRGCPYKCSFCCKNHDMYIKFRYRSAENVFLELKELVASYGIEHVKFIDDCFTLIPQRVKKICEYTKKLGITFVCTTRADQTTDKILHYLKQGGCTTVSIGVESASPRLINLMNKNETVQQMKKCIINAKKIGLKTKVFLQYGLPTETDEDINLTLSFLKDTKPEEYRLSKFTPLNGSEWEIFLEEKMGSFYPDDDIERSKLMEKINCVLDI